MLNSFLKPLFADIKTFVLDTLFPITCVSCGKEKKYLCDECSSTLINVNQYCIICQKPSPAGLTHPKCQAPHAADQLISIFDYHDEKISALIIHGKYYFLPDVYRLLGLMVADAVKKNFPHLNATTYALIAIPLHKWRLRWRGFNQAQVLCEEIGKELNLPTFDILMRKKTTRTQKDLKKEERVKNMESAFAIRSTSPLAGEGGVRGNNFILIDDVTTTGSTLNEAAKILKRNGASKVICLTVARD
ncbi:MAG: ComF family protein [Candidatus Doudnabacteria bacterium]|nr:ComF family protein [Candidatus Doudnabacteria bacterium]